MEINWNLLQPVDTGALVGQGFQTGMAMVKHVQTQNALKSYLASPDDPQAYNALAYLDPGAASTIQQQRLLQRKVMLDQQDRERAVSLGELAVSNPRGAHDEAVASGDFDLAKQFGEMDDANRKRGAEFWQQAGPIAFKLKQTNDPQQRQELWAQARPILESQGADPAMLDKFDPTNDTQLDAAVTLSQKISDLIDQGKITWHQQGEQPSFATDSMGRPVGSQNPYAGAGQPAASTGEGARGDRNNNPLNLTKSDFTTSQPGYAGTDNGGRYAKFGTPEAGMQAGHQLLASYLQRGFDTPTEIVGRWAPASENGDASTANYIAYVSRRLGISPNQPLTQDQIPVLAEAMAEFENGGQKGGQRRVASVGGVPHVGSKAEFDKLPSGSLFIAPDGSKRRKP